VTLTIKPAPVRKALTVRAPAEKAFKVFTEGFDRWWPRSHSIGDSPLKRAVLEPKPGGRWYSLLEDGSECEWGEVLAYEPPTRLLLAWRIDGAWKFDPELLTEVEVTFTALPDGQTRVELEHRGLERMVAAGEAARAAIDSPGGWGGILELFKSSAEA
jgi:uncharacterized protein YndB with AHSA1/START domain